MDKWQFLAVDAVIGEPVSVSEIPCFEGKYRENLPLEAADGRSGPRISEQIQTVRSEFPKNRSREIR